MGRRVPLLGLALAAALAIAIPTVVWVCFGAHGAWVTFQIVAPLAFATVLAGEWITTRRPGGLRRQFALIAALGVVALAAGVALFVSQMFLSNHDGLMAVLLAIYAGALVLWVTGRLAARALHDLDAVRTTLAAVAEGRRDVRVAPTGDDEIARLGRQVDDDDRAPGPRGADAPRAVRGRLARPAHADHGARPARHRDRRLDRRRGQAPRVRRPHEHARPPGRGADRRPLRPHPAGGAGARVDDGARSRSATSSTTPWRRCARPPTPARSPCART